MVRPTRLVRLGVRRGRVGAMRLGRLPFLALTLALTLGTALLLGGCRSDTQWISDDARAAQAQRARYGPCTPTCRVPIYETVMEPVYEKRTTPVYKEFEAPVWSYKEEPIYTTHYEPVEGFKTQPVMIRRKKPVKIEFQGKCGMAEKTLYCVDQCVPAGTERVPATLGYRAVEKQWGVKRVPVVVGYERKRQRNGCKTECVRVGERPVRRICGWKTVSVEEARQMQAQEQQAR